MLIVFQKKLSKKNLQVSVFLPFLKMLSKKMHVSDNFLLQFQDEANRYIDIYNFGIEPVGFQTPTQSRSTEEHLPSGSTAAS